MLVRIKNFYEHFSFENLYFMGYRIKTEGMICYTAVMYKGTGTPSVANMIALVFAETLAEIIDFAAEMIENEIGNDPYDGNREFFDHCRGALKEHGFVLGETDTGEDEWTVRIFQEIVFCKN